MKLREDALKVLEATSRTFFIPISRLPPTLQEAVGAAYLCMRAIDEIEDHPALANATKARLLRSIARTYESGTPRADGGAFCGLFEAANVELPDVTVRLGEWNALAPQAIAPRVFDATAAMAERMAGWADRGWQVRSEADLDRYTYGVAGAVGLLLSDIWAWYDGTSTDRARAVGFGRGLQAVNILRNRADDVRRGVDFFPEDWTDARMFDYARRNLEVAAAYIADLPPGPVRDFCSLPHALADATLDALASGRPKLSREQVRQLASR
ncbi:MAG TPA: phytoene/squalene synthase family protein [Trueperaceae bacterium]|nr:phytoene/squalene synthase family protein [Trueperaceae bacterium]